MSWKGQRRTKPDDTRYETLIQELRFARMALRISQQNLADKAGFHKDMVVYWESMKVVPSATSLVRWAHVLGGKIRFIPSQEDYFTLPARVVPDPGK